MGVPVVPITLLVIGGIFTVTYANAFAQRRRRETRTRVLEVMAAAVQRGLPLAPALAHVALEVRGKTRKAVLAVSGELEGGAGVGDALEVACPWLLPRPMVASIQACDGTPALAGVLRAAGRQTLGTLAATHKLWLAVIYPALVLLLASVTWIKLQQLTDSISAAGPAGHNLPVGTVIGWTLALIAIAWLVTRFHASVRALPLLGRLADLVSLDVPPFRTTVRLGASERTLRTMAALASAGTPLGDLLEQAAPAAGNRALARNVAAAGDMVRSGALPEEVWAVTAFPRFVQARLALACRQEPALFAAALSELADACAARYAARIASIQRWVRPATVSVAGAVVAFEFFLVMRVLENARMEAMPW